MRHIGDNLFSTPSQSIVFPRVTRHGYARAIAMSVLNGFNLVYWPIAACVVLGLVVCCARRRIVSDGGVDTADMLLCALGLGVTVVAGWQFALAFVELAAARGQTVAAYAGDVGGFGVLADGLRSTYDTPGQSVWLWASTPLFCANALLFAVEGRRARLPAITLSMLGTFISPIVAAIAFIVAWRHTALTDQLERRGDPPPPATWVALALVAVCFVTGQPDPPAAAVWSLGTNFLAGIDGRSARRDSWQALTVAARGGGHISRAQWSLARDELDRASRSVQALGLALAALACAVYWIELGRFLATGAPLTVLLGSLFRGRAASVSYCDTLLAAVLWFVTLARRPMGHPAHVLAAVLGSAIVSPAAALVGMFLLRERVVVTRLRAWLEAGRVSEDTVELGRLDPWCAALTRQRDWSSAHTSPRSLT